MANNIWHIYADYFNIDNDTLISLKKYTCEDELDPADIESAQSYSIVTYYCQSWDVFDGHKTKTLEIKLTIVS